MPQRRISAFALICAAVVTFQKSSHAQLVQLRGGGKSNGRNLARCVSNVWHMDFTKTSGNWCSNSKGYPDSFNSIPNALQPSAAECCAAVFPGQKCQVNRVCDEDKDAVAASQPSQQTVWKPGDTSESKPTRRPTARPNPAIPLTKYYLISSTGMCDTVGEKTPSWMTDSDFFNDWTECCRKSWKFDLCLSRAPPGAIPKTLIEEDTQIIYYAIPSSGKCVEKDEKTPSWMGENDFFSDYFDCCKKSSWNTDICILEAPSYLTAEPTPSPSESPTPNPSDRPTPNPTMNPTAAPNKPSTSPITSNPTGKPTQDLIDECDARLWHPSSDFSMCSNR